MKRGFTLIEILTVIIIIAVIAAIAIPGFARTRDKHRANQAVIYLRAIRLAEMMYFSKNGTYVDLTNCPSGTCTGAAAIRASLGVEVSEEFVTFDVVQAAASFTATARQGVTYTIALNQTGPPFTCTGTLPANFACPIV